MEDALKLAVSGMHGAMERVNVLAHNMVNLSTPGYRREIPVQRPFPALMADGAGAAVELDTSPGALRATGRGFDLGLLGEGYFVVATPAGPAYTRAGSFHLEADGRLVNEAGHPVQGAAGDIVVRGAPPSFGAQGEILQEGREIGRIRIVRLPARALSKGPDGLLRAEGVEPAPAEGVRMRSGHLETSNVSPLTEMVALSEATRQFEAAQRLFQGYDEQLGSAIRTLAQF